MLLTLGDGAGELIIHCEIPEFRSTYSSYYFSPKQSIEKFEIYLKSLEESFLSTVCEVTVR